MPRKWTPDNFKEEMHLRTANYLVSQHSFVGQVLFWLQVLDCFVPLWLFGIDATGHRCKTKHAVTSNS